MSDNPLWKICERVAELQALLDDHPVINLKNAKSLNLTIPPSLLATAGGVIEWTFRNAEIYVSEVTLWVMYGRRPRCKRESDFSAKRSGAVMYSACFRLEACLHRDAAAMAAGPDVIR
jgi:hypothetical protein